MSDPIKPVIVGGPASASSGVRADEDLLQGLNPPQREAVTYRGPALLIVAIGRASCRERV